MQLSRDVNNTRIREKMSMKTTSNAENLIHITQKLIEDEEVDMKRRSAGGGGSGDAVGRPVPGGGESIATDLGPRPPRPLPQRDHAGRRDQSTQTVNEEVERVVARQSRVRWRKSCWMAPSCSEWQRGAATRRAEPTSGVGPHPPSNELDGAAPERGVDDGENTVGVGSETRLFPGEGLRLLPLTVCCSCAEAGCVGDHGEVGGVDEALA